MSDDYDNDGIPTREVLALTIQAATMVKALGNLIACRSWMVAKLTLREAQVKLDEIKETVTTKKAKL